MLILLLSNSSIVLCMHLRTVAEACPDVRVLFIDTQGPTSQRDLEYGRQLLDHLGLKNLTVVKADVTREEFRQGMEEVGIAPEDKVFHTLSQDVFKVNPLKKHCVTSGVQCLLSGVRRGQTKERDHFKFLQYSQDPASKAHPILDWSDEECLEFLRFNRVPPHPELDSLLDDVINSAAARSSSPADIGASSSLRSRRPSRSEGKECGIHIQDESNKMGGKEPVPLLPNIVVGKLKCKFCVAAKELLADSGIDYVEAPVHLFSHLIPAGAKTLPIVYLDKKMIGGYSNLCEYLDVEDTLNTK